MPWKVKKADATGALGHPLARADPAELFAFSIPDLPIGSSPPPLHPPRAL